MLVLTRKINEEIRIGDNVTITIVEVRGDRVRVGISAPQDVPVHRREVYDAIKRNERKAAAVPVPRSSLLSSMVPAMG